MSALRLGRLPDGTRDIRIVDDGAVGRIHMTRYGIAGGGALVLGRKPIPLPVPATTPERQAQMAAYKAKRKAGEVCGRSLPSGVCGRVLGHGWECRTGTAMARMAERKRTGGVVR